MEHASRDDVIEGMSSNAGQVSRLPERRMTSMSELRERMIADMTAASLSASTKEVYVRGVRGLAAYYRRSPDQLTEGDPGKA